ncbi:hypothetical protein AGMMS4957_11200 [Bacteroidia bacterium]|nr:hypothetical protein AGMMS4957_11200 [Bacteroidia bacterium]
MAYLTGITIERNDLGVPTFIKINYRKYATLLQSFLFENGIDLEIDVPNSKTAKAIKEVQNHKELQSFDSVDALLADCLK